MSDVRNVQTFSGRPHILELFNPLLLMPMSAVVVYSCVRPTYGGVDIFEFTIVCAVGLALTVMLLMVFVGLRSGSVWKIENNVLHSSRGFVNKREMTLCLDRISMSEMSDNPLYSLFGGTRVRLYSSASTRAVFSMILPKTQAVKLINLTAAVFCSEAVKPRRLARRKYSALLVGLSSRSALIFLSAAAVLCVFGYGSVEIYIIAAALWLFAALNAIAYVIAECRMSVCRVNTGYAVQTGFFGGRRIFVPDRAVIGIFETRNPIAAFFGAGKFELLCAGGKRITCIQWYDGEHSDEAARRMIGCAGRRRTEISNFTAVRLRYFKIIAADVIGIIGTWVLSKFVPLYLRDICVSLAAFIILIIMAHCLIALKSCGDFGVSISGSSIRIGGMTLLGAEYLTLRRGKFAVIKIRQNFFDRLNGTCTAEFIAKGCKRGVKCHCMSYDRIAAIAERIY